MCWSSVFTIGVFIRHNVHLLAQSLGLGRLSAPVLLPWARAAAHRVEARRRLSRTILKLGTQCIV